MSTVAAPRASSAAVRPSRARPLAWVVLTQAVALASLIPWALVTGFSALGSGPALLPAPLLYAFWAYPALVLGAGVAEVRGFRRGDTRAAVRWGAVQLLCAAVFLSFEGNVFLPVR